MNALHYLLQANLYLALFYGFYYLWLRRETFHQLNRAYLLAAAALSLFIPVLQSDWVRSWFLTERVHEAVYTYYDLDAVFVTALPQQAVGLTWGDAFAFVYMAGVLVGLGRLSFQLAHLQQFLSRRKSTAGRMAFSFFNHLVVGRHLDGRDTILIHERVHARQLHSADVLLVELLAIFNWFNPAVYAYRQSLRAVHEFIADQHASRHAPTKADYALLLFAKQFGASTLGISPQLTNSFFNQSLLLRRVAMLQKSHSPRRALLKYGLTAPLFGAMLVFSSAAVSDSRALEAVERVVQSAQSVSTLPLVAFEPDGTEAGFPDLAEAVALSPELQRVMRRDTVEPLFTMVEEPAQFPGGNEALGRFLARNLRYPTEAKAASATGKVFVSFVVEKNGAVTNAQVMKGIGYGTEAEALRVVRLMPVWKPGRQSGRVVRSQFVLPFTFALDGQQLPAEANPKTDSAVVLGEIVAVAYPPREVASPVLQREMRGDTVEPLFTVVQKPAGYPGGVSKLMKFLRKNLTYPAAARQANVEGKVFLSFIVEKDGAISTIQVMKGLGFGCDEEAVRVVEAMPKWTPGKQDGRAVRSRFTIPIAFP